MQFNPSYVPAITSIFGGLLGYGEGKQNERLAREQKKLAEQNALLEARELQEQVRRQIEEDARIRSAALARAAASGAKISGSVAFYLDYMETEQNRQLDWLKTAGASRIRLNLANNMMQAEATRIRAKSQQYSAILTGLAGGFKALSDAGVFTSETTVKRSGPTRSPHPPSAYPPGTRRTGNTIAIPLSREY